MTGRESPFVPGRARPATPQFHSARRHLDSSVAPLDRWRGEKAQTRASQRFSTSEVVDRDWILGTVQIHFIRVVLLPADDEMCGDPTVPGDLDGVLRDRDLTDNVLLAQVHTVTVVGVVRRGSRQRNEDVGNQPKGDKSAAAAAKSPLPTVR